MFYDFPTVDLCLFYSLLSHSIPLFSAAYFVVHMTKNLILGTTGYINHGKTSLVMALTGVGTDR
jgi:hypothetical protein